MKNTNVLFDAPGPVAKRNIFIGNIVGVIVIVAVLLYILNGLAEKDQLSAAKWSPFLEGDTWQYYILPGLLNTLKAAAVAILTSVVLGLALGLGRLSAFAPLRWITGTIVEFLRAVPVLLMMIFLWFGISMLEIMPAGNVPFVAVVTALTLYNGSVIAELVRSGVHGLPKGQRESALAIGMTRPQSLRSIEVPQALVAMLPALISQFVVILKDSALGYIITYSELLSTSRRLGSGEGNMLPALIVAAIVFIVINYALSSLAQWLSQFLSFSSNKPVRKERPLMDANNNAGVV